MKFDQKSFSYTKFHKKTKWPEGSIYSGAFNCQNVINLKMLENLWIFGWLRLQFKHFCNFLKNPSVYTDPSGHFVFYEIFCSSKFYYSFFFNCWKVKYLRHSKIIILIFSVNLPVIFSYKFCRKLNKIQPPGVPWELNLLNFNNERRNWYGLLYLCLSTKSWHNNIKLSYLIVLFFGFRVP